MQGQAHAHTHDARARVQKEKKFRVYKIKDSELYYIRYKVKYNIKQNAKKNIDYITIDNIAYVGEKNQLNAFLRISKDTKSQKRLEEFYDTDQEPQQIFDQSIPSYQAEHLQHHLHNFELRSEHLIC